MNYTYCEFCNKEISNNNIKKHLKSHENKIEKQNKPKKSQIGRKAWNKGLTKETSEIIQKIIVSQLSTYDKQRQDGTLKRRKLSEREKTLLSERQSLFNTGGKCKWFNVAGQKVQGTYERRFAEQLELEQIEWEKIKTNNKIFKYYENNKLKSYAPDFYLPQFDIFIEIKGFWWGNDKQKMEIIRLQHFDKKLIVIFGEDELQVACNSIKTFIQNSKIWNWN